MSTANGVYLKRFGRLYTSAKNFLKNRCPTPEKLMECVEIFEKARLEGNIRRHLLEMRKAKHVNGQKKLTTKSYIQTLSLIQGCLKVVKSKKISSYCSKRKTILALGAHLAQQLSKLYPQYPSKRQIMRSGDPEGSARIFFKRAIQHPLIAETLIKNYSHWTRLAIEENDNKVVMLAAVEKYSLILPYASDRLKKDTDIVLAAVKQDESALYYASEELQQDRLFILAVVKVNSLALQYALPQFQKDKSIIRAANKQNTQGSC